MKIRRSRCFHILALLVLVNVIAFSILRHREVSNTLLSGKFKQISLEFNSFSTMFEPKDSYSFDKWANVIFRKLQEDEKDTNAARMAAYNVDRINSGRDSIDLPNYLFGEGTNPHLVPFDPRLTLGILLNDLNAQLAVGTPVDALRMNSFHWADWTDLSALENLFLSTKGSKYTCSELDLRPDEINYLQKDIVSAASKFCIDDADIDRELSKVPKDSEMGLLLRNIKDAPNKIGFHVFRNPKRTSQRVRLLAAPSYLYNFMPPPMAVHFLVPTSTPGTFSSIHIPLEIAIHDRVKLIDSAAATSVAKRTRKIDIVGEIQKLAARVNTNNVTIAPYHKTPVHKDFLDSSESELEKLKAALKLSRQDKLYKDSLQLSLDTLSPTKYFYEAAIVRKDRDWAYGSHHDWRFFKGIRYRTDLQLPMLHGLISAWLRFTNANDITTWIAHGTLLGWYWNGLSFPWDSDIDVQMPIADLHKISRKFNQTVIVDLGSNPSSEVKLGRYFLDCGTWISHRDPGNGENNIDARFVDMDSGLYIDITGIAVSATMAPMRYDEQLPAKLQRKKTDGKPDMKWELQRNAAAQLYNCRNKHFSSLSEVSPLRATTMEGVMAYVPNKFVDVLQAEYGKKGTSAQKFKAQAYLPRIRIWTNARTVAKYTRTKKVEGSKMDLGSDSKAASDQVDRLSIFTFSDRDYFELMMAEKGLVSEYMVSKDFTALHVREMELLLQGQSTEGLLFENGHFKVQLPSLRRDVNDYIAFKDKIDFNSQVKSLGDRYRAFHAGENTDKKDFQVSTDKDTAFDNFVRGLGIAIKMQTAEEANDDSRTRPEPQADVIIA